jgi:hypothetical protein
MVTGAQRRPARSIAGLLAPTIALACVLALAGCGSGSGSGSTTRNGLRLQREDLAAVAHALAGSEAQVAREVTAAKVAWPAVANGLEPRRSPAEPASIRTAARLATSLRVPALLAEPDVRTLTGPASGVAGLFRGFDTLAGRGWQMIDGSLDALEHGRPAAAAFARANVALYIESVYDAHFELAQIGRRLLRSYEELGGAAAFGSMLTQATVDRLAGDFSEARARLHPHNGVKLGS